MLRVATQTASSRAHTEDRLATHHVPGGLVAIVADGAGGLVGGARAADIVLRTVADALARPDFNPFLPTSLSALLIDADSAIARDRSAGEATCVLVAASDHGRIIGASVGDSEAIVVAPSGAIDDLTEKQRRKLRLGSARATPVAFERRTFSGTLVIATDGLFAYARPEVIARLVREHDDLDAAVACLIESVRLPGGSLNDDVAIIASDRR